MYNDKGKYKNSNKKRKQLLKIEEAPGCKVKINLTSFTMLYICFDVMVISAQYTATFFLRSIVFPRMWELGLEYGD